MQEHENPSLIYYIYTENGARYFFSDRSKFISEYPKGIMKELREMGWEKNEKMVSSELLNAALENTRKKIRKKLLKKMNDPAKWQALVQKIKN